MARDVEANLTASDKTGPGIASAERRFTQASKKIKDEGDKLNSNFAKSAIGLVEKVSPRAAKALTGAMTNAFASASEAGGPLLVGGIAAAAPLVAATVSAALIAGAAVGAVAIGVAIVAQDARVKAAGQHLGESLMAGLRQDASSFIQPVLGAIDLLEARFAESRTVIKSIFDNASQFVRPLTDGVTRGLQGILRGVDALVANAGPVVDELADGIAQVGNDFGEFMAQIAANGDGAAAALGLIFDTLSMILNITGPLIAGLTMVFGLLDKLGLVSGLLTSLAGPIGMVASAFDDTKTKTEATTTSATGLAGAFQKSAEATEIQRQAAANLGPTMQQIQADIDAVTTANRALYGSNADVTLALRDADKAIKENTGHGKSKAIQDAENARVLETVAATLQTNYNNFVKVNGESAASVAKGAELRASFIKTATGALGSATAARRLANEILGIPAKKQTDLHANTHDAEARIRALQAQVNALHGKTVTVEVRTRYPASRDNADKLRFDAGSTWSASDGGGGSRTGGAMSVNSRIDNRIYLDGRPFRAYVDEVVAESDRANAYAARVGTR